MKAVRSLEIGAHHLYLPKFHHMPVDELLDYIKDGTDDRIFALAQLMWLGVDYNRLCNITGIDMLFLDKIHNIVELEREIKDEPITRENLLRAKRMAFPTATSPTCGSAASETCTQSGANSASSPCTR